MRRFIPIAVAVLIAAALTLTGCDTFGVSLTVPTQAATVTPGVMPENTPEPTAAVDSVGNPAEGTPAPSARPVNNEEGSMDVGVNIGGAMKDITLKRQESSLGYVMYVWEDRFAYKLQDGKEVYTLDWQGMKLPEVSISIELLKYEPLNELVNATAALIGNDGDQVELIGDVLKPAYLLDGTLLRVVRYGDYETTTDAFLLSGVKDGMLRVIINYFPEAMEDVGQAIVPMLDSLVISE